MMLFTYCLLVCNECTLPSGKSMETHTNQNRAFFVHLQSLKGYSLGGRFVLFTADFSGMADIYCSANLN